MMTSSAARKGASVSLESPAGVSKIIRSECFRKFSTASSMLSKFIFLVSLKEMLAGTIFIPDLCRYNAFETSFFPRTTSCKVTGKIGTPK